MPLSSPVGAPAPHAPPSRRNVPVVSHAQYILMVTAAPASRIKAVVSKVAWWPWPLTLKVVSESRVTWATSVPILVFLGLSVLELGPMYAADVRQKHRLMPPPTRGGSIIIRVYSSGESCWCWCLEYGVCSARQPLLPRRQLQNASSSGAFSLFAFFTRVMRSIAQYLLRQRGWLLHADIVSKCLNLS